MGDAGKAVYQVFSAHAEVVPYQKNHGAAQPRILRARGGSSKTPKVTGKGQQYSPRMRR